MEDNRTKKLCWFMFFLALYFLDGKPILDALNNNLDAITQDCVNIAPSIKLILIFTSNKLQLLSRHHVAAVALSYLLSIVWFVATIGNTNFVGR